MYTVLITFDKAIRQRLKNQGRENHHLFHMFVIMHLVNLFVYFDLLVIRIMWATKVTYKQPIGTY